MFTTRISEECRGDNAVASGSGSNPSRRKGRGSAMDAYPHNDSQQHEEDEIQPPCRDFLRGHCQNGARYRFSHPSFSSSADIVNAGASPTRFSDSDETYLGDEDGSKDAETEVEQVRRRVTEDEAVEFFNNYIASS